MNRFFKIITILLLIVSLNVQSQSNFNYELSLVPVSVTNLPGLHSYAYAQYQGKWLIIGGRKDGLHARQPFNAFPASQFLPCSMAARNRQSRRSRVETALPDQT